MNFFPATESTPWDGLEGRGNILALVFNQLLDSEGPFVFSTTMRNIQKQ